MKPTTTDIIVYSGLGLVVIAAGIFTFTQAKKLKEREKELEKVIKHADAKMEEFENCCLASGGMSNMAKIKMKLNIPKDKQNEPDWNANM